MAISDIPEGRAKLAAVLPAGAAGMPLPGRREGDGGRFFLANSSFHERRESGRVKT